MTYDDLLFFIDGHLEESAELQARAIDLRDRIEEVVEVWAVTSSIKSIGRRPIDEVLSETLWQLAELDACPIELDDENS